MRIACIQTAANDITQYKENWDNILQMIDEAASNEVSLIVLPECAYPAYFLGLDLEKTREAMAHIDRVKEDIAARAKRHKVYIAAGLAVEEEGRMLNGGLLFSPDGELVCSIGKCNLWHFDHKWFECGTSFDVVHTRMGKVGLIICADGRAPEITRILALKGARIIIDMANLTASGRNPAKLSNPQFDYMLRVRAIENGVWLIMADKAGIEADTVVYAGRSCVINPEGEVVAAASADKPEILYADIDEKPSEKNLPKRRPEAYRILTEPTETLPVYKDMSQPVAVWDTEFQVSVVQFGHVDEDEYAVKAARFIRILENQDSRLILLPQLKEGADIENCVANIKQALSHPSTIVALTGYLREGENKYKTTVIFSKDRNYGRYDKIHVEEPGEEGLVPGSAENAVIKTPLGKLGVMHDQEGLIPEVARSLMLGGADIILWSDSRYDERNDMIVQTRAAENKVYVARSGNMEQGDHSVIASPMGNIAASTFKGTDQATSSLIVTALSKSKTIVPGTNVVLDRKPKLYKELVK
ncbi:MAG TPA: carbon-nitrogen hydrolase family protein [Thermoanaerobacterales bacterium]|nr:carbon-nitrogen hydrolase family protein [Thermoanaerobacterales bacterium]